MTGDAAVLVPPATPAGPRPDAMRRLLGDPAEPAARCARRRRRGPPQLPDGARRAGAGAAPCAGARGRRRALAADRASRLISSKPVVQTTSSATKHIFVTGGVASSLGKGLTASSLGHLLRGRGLRVAMQKLDPYLNVDPGTMNPFQHGEVFVTEDGAETDLDIGHYERFLDVEFDRSANVTTGQVYSRGHRQGAARGVPRRHRPGDPAHHQRDQGADAGAGRRRTAGST